ncbi:MAG: GAF domain-containing protein [Chthoniobacterales bacterium]
MKNSATNKMLQELGAFILAGAKGPRDVKTMVDMIQSARGYCWVGIYKTNGKEMEIVAGSGNETPCYRRFPITQGLCGAAHDSKKTIVVDDVHKDVRYLPAFHTTRAEIVVPVISRSDRVVGMIVADSAKKAFAKEDREVLEKIALMMGQTFK